MDGHSPVRVGEGLFIPPQALAGKRILIVEDEMLVVLLLESTLADFGCIVVGSCSTVAEALKAVEAETLLFDAALLDVNLNGERVFPVAYALAERHIPFLFVSGYGAGALPPNCPRDWVVCAKPFKVDDLAAMLLATIARADRS